MAAAKEETVRVVTGAGLAGPPTVASSDRGGCDTEAGAFMRGAEVVTIFSAGATIDFVVVADEAVVFVVVVVFMAVVVVVAVGMAPPPNSPPKNPSIPLDAFVGVGVGVSTRGVVTA